ncbi:MAG: protease complex subunit PrcB family protein [Anaerolineales bacterium]|nr:protease complex subunit PrcB family protein [Anaerolineales bacterium]
MKRNFGDVVMQYNFDPRQIYRVLFTFWGAFLLLLLAIGCNKDQGMELPFETIERASSSWRIGYYQDEEPKLVVLTETDEIDDLGETISTTAEAILRHLNFDQEFAVVVFQGLKGSDDYGVEIQKISVQENTVMIIAHFTERNPDPDFVIAYGNTSPYHIAKVERNGLHGWYQVTLNVDSKVIIQQPKFIP